jgi:hypothetical protein
MRQRNAGKTEDYLTPLQIGHNSLHRIDAPGPSSQLKLKSCPVRNTG